MPQTELAELRMRVLDLLQRRAIQGWYNEPERVGYRGWVEIPDLGVLAFVRLDGVLVYGW